MRLLSFFAHLLGAVALADGQDEAPIRPLRHAHAHNDYEHKRPLADALARGFCSVEADIHLRDGRLLVGHDAKDLRPERTLETLYLRPLLARVKANGGRVYKDGPPFWLLIDQKTAAESTYKVLHETLEQYQEMLSTTSGEKHKAGAVTVVISGNRPIEFMKTQLTRYAGVDARLTDLESDAPAHQMPMISDNWGLHFRWRGRGDMDAEERMRMRSIVEKAHARGRIVRFWATPEEPALWRELRAAGVDLINTDQLDLLRQVLLEIESAGK
jgi:glycerophosphoryl diester phosphodiesterase